MPCQHHLDGKPCKSNLGAAAECYWQWDYHILYQQYLNQLDGNASCASCCQPGRQCDFVTLQNVWLVAMLTKHLTLV